MNRTSWMLAAVAALGLASSVALYRKSSRLESRLAALDSESPRSDGDQRDLEAPELGSPRASSAARDLLARLGRRNAADRPKLPDAPKETRQQRRVRRQSEIRNFLGRAPGETAEEYMARIKPLIETGLEVPRERLTEARAEVEKLAGVTDEQRDRLDAAFDDVYDEAIELTNQAIASGELTPYESNWSGAAQLVGGLGAILDGAETRIGAVLSLEQMRTIRDSGFEWGEYLGASAPWENLEPPPPPPGDDS